MLRLSISELVGSIEKHCSIINDIIHIHFITNLIVIAILQVCYIRLDHTIKTTRTTTTNLDNKQKDSLLGLKDDIYQWLIWLSPLRPEFKFTTLIFYVSLGISLIIFHFMLRRSKDYDLGRELLFSYMLNPEEGKRDIERKMDLLIQDLISSNSNYTSKMITKFENQIEKESRVMRYNSWSNSIAKANLKSKCVYSSLSFKSIEKNLKFLQRELRFLQSLLTDKESIWPRNRNPIWLDRLRRKWLLIASMIVVNFLILCDICTIATFHFSHQHAATSKQSLGSRSSIPRSIFIFESFFMVLAMGYDFMVPLINISFSLFDLRELVKSFRNQVEDFERLISKAEKFKSQYNHNKDLDDNEQDRSHSFPGLINCETTDPVWDSIPEENQHRRNIMSIKAYLTFRYTVIQCRLIKMNGVSLIDSFAISMSSTFAICFLSTFKTEQTVDNESHTLDKMGRVIVVFILINMNIVFFVYAAFNAFLLRNVKPIWSILKMLNQEYDLEEDTSISIRTSKRTSINSNIRELQHTTNSSPIILNSCHMSHVWNKLVREGQTELIELFTFYILNFFPLNYHGMIKFNFWVGSIFMFYHIYLYASSRNSHVTVQNSIVLPVMTNH